MKKLLSVLPMLAVITLPAHAEEEAPAAPQVAYVELAPSFVTNYQSAKIRYLKADVTLKVEGSTVEAVKRHQPLIRNNLVMLFSRQSEQALQSPEGRQHLKEEARQEVINALQSENEPVDVQEVLFTSFIVD